MSSWETRFLPAFSHLSPRDTLAHVLCFPVDPNLPSQDKFQVANYLKTSLGVLWQNEPLLRSSLRQHTDGRLFLGIPSDSSARLNLDTIQVKNVPWISVDYIKSRALDGFSVSPERYSSSARLALGEWVPVSSPEIWAIEDGVLFFFHVMQCVIDEVHIRKLIAKFAQASHGQKLDIPIPVQNWTHIMPTNAPGAFESLLRECQEYRLNELGGDRPFDDRAPCDMIRPSDFNLKGLDRQSELFTLSWRGIEYLSSQLAVQMRMREEHTNILAQPCYVALFWVAVMGARAQEAFPVAASSSPQSNPHILMPVTTRSLPHGPESTVQQHSGNIACQTVWASVSRVPRSAFEYALDTTQPFTAFNSLMSIAYHINEALQGVHNTDFVKKRLDLVQAAPDTRLLGLNFDPCNKSNFLMHPGHFMAPHAWDLGQGGVDVRPINRLCEIPPAGTAQTISTQGENLTVQVTLPRESMERFKSVKFDDLLAAKGVEIKPLVHS